MNFSRERTITEIQNDYKEQVERQNQLKKRRRKGLYRRLTVFGALVFLTAIVLASSVWSQTSSLSAKEEKKEQLEKELKSLKTKQTDLKEEISKLKDEDYVTELARRDLFMSGDGEIIFNVEKKSK
ncbi:cell division protein DivIC [Bacillus subtilis]|uniref:Cell division protein DivIC n=7 Tax=Bacillus TaxID=1386 RepID=DIVIC_BACSU|nr:MULTISPECIES: cell division protein DivIC [Bacillales]NP_387943.1 cell-division initiation protein [Bacillus subtilis subsp. subtilis str. 168]P37471.1 RecName: Full=Cell division protein DivIC [Bacillus subtilis subsp. subtilis str. 168]AOL31882.1 cell division protein DIVIC [Alkalicoccobacillus gibsonii]AUZ24845.1 cell division protein DIVIC [Bacillus cereus]AXC51400.1 cell division protein DIVIC [Bacillus spizizenii]MBG9708078.1 cell division protein DIVIC [Lysinibacillus sphaericus]MB